MTPATLTFLKKSLPALAAPAGVTYRLPDKRLAVQTGYVTKSIDRGRMAVKSVLTFPGRDYDGDTVRPDGGDWQRKFPANPLVNWEHDEPVARGSVPVLESFGDHGRLPTGESRFFQSAADTRGLQLIRRGRGGRITGLYEPGEAVHAAQSAFRLVADDIAPGVSIEFEPDGVEGKAFWKSTGKDSLLLGRPEMHWERWVGLGWAHALQAKNPNAATILPAESDRWDKAFRIAETGKFPGGEKVSPLILKSFAGLKHTTRYHRVPERKAMPDPYEAPEGVDDVDDVDDADAPQGGGMKPTPTAYMQAIQHLQDGKQAIQELLDNGSLEHEKGIAGLQSHLEDLQSLCDDLNTAAAKMFPDAGFESAKADPAPEPDGDEMPVETNDDGAVTNKAFPGGFPVRFRVARGGGYERVGTPAAVPADVAEDQIDPVALKAIENETAELLRRAAKVARRRRRNDRAAARNGY